MAPKFRGGSDDWLDDEKTKKAARTRKGEKPKAQRPEALKPEEANGTVAEVFPNQCRVRVDDDRREVLCMYRRAGVMGAGGGETRERAPVAVGDRVKVSQLTQTSGVVDGLCIRSNFLSRIAPGRETRNVRHVIAANVDVLAIVDSVHDPEFSYGLVDRYLVAASAAGIEPMIIATKSDLAAPGESPEKLYVELGYPVFRVSAKKGVGIEELRSALVGRKVVFCGHSGVGKTSLLRALIGSDIGKIGSVSESGKGRHTTTSAILLGGAAGTDWIDTPGVREFALEGVGPGNLARFFSEFQGLECTVRGCHHYNEEDCAATGLPRYASYRRILEAMYEEDREKQEA